MIELALENAESMLEQGRGEVCNFLLLKYLLLFHLNMKATLSKSLCRLMLLKSVTTVALVISKHYCLIKHSDQHSIATGSANGMCLGRGYLID